MKFVSVQWIFHEQTANSWRTEWFRQWNKKVRSSLRMLAVFPKQKSSKRQKTIQKDTKKVLYQIKKKKIPVCDLSCCWPDHFYFVKNVHLLIWAGNTEYSITCALIEMSWIRICKNSESESESKSEFNQLLHTKHSTVE